MTVLDRLRATRRLISTPMTWCQTYLARDATGLPAMPSDPHACQWCLLGAIAKVSDDAVDSIAVANELRKTMESQDVVGFGSLAGLNDYSDHARVLRLIDDTIARLEAGP